MRIQHNLSAMNSLSNYKSNNSALSNNLEKLSSGYKINSAADDAAGLAISEKMRSQIAGLEKAQDNANDGISLVQTAEGALTEVNSMLTRLTTLATQSANGTYEDGVDRANIQEETDALLSEIDRISESTNFNGIKLLDGSLSGKSQIKNLALTESTATKGKFTTDGIAGGGFTGSAAVVTASQMTNYASAPAVVGSATASNVTAAMSAVGFNFSDLTKDDIGSSLSYTVTWTDKDGNEQTTTAKLTFQGQGDGTIAAMDTGSTTAGKAGADDAKGVKNYFTDDQGNKYYLEKLTSASNVNASTTQVTGYRLTASSIQNAFKAGLENNEEFASNFEITKNTNGSFTFETKATGADTATITGVSGGANFESKTIADNSKVAGWMAGNGVKDSGGGSVTINREAADAMQKFDANKLDVITGTSTAEDIANKTFEIDGSKFVIADSTVSTEQLKGMDSDLHVIELGNTHGKGTIDSADTKKIAAEIQKATGRETAVYNDPDGDHIADSDRNIKDTDVVFKDVDNKLKTKGNDLTLQIGDTADSYQQVNVKIQDMSSKGLGLKGLDLSTQESASKSIDTIKQAVNAVSSQRGQLGALQNRLDHTLNSLDATNQNITAAESQIRDTDMAKEMTQYSKNNILAQAAQSMLAQANSMPQGVLSLLG